MIIQNVKLVNVGYVVDVQPIITQNLLANYDAATGISGATFLDSSGNGYDATIFNSPTTTTYNGTTVLNLDSASSQYFTYTGGYPAAANDITHDVWFYSTATTGTQQTLISEWNGYPYPTGWTDAQLGMNSNGKIAGAVWNNSGAGLESTDTWTNNTWYNAVLSYSNSVLSLYLNGVLQTSSPTWGRIMGGDPYYAYGYPDATNGMYLGGVKDYFKGYIGAVKLYSIGLTQAQVTQNFNALRGRYGV